MTLVNASGEPVRRVLIGIPCQDTVDAGFALDLARLTATMTGAWTLVENRGSILPQQRATLVKAAQAWGATHLLFLDADMRFPADTLTQLLAHGKPIVAANYARRRTPILPTAEDSDRGYLFTDPDATELTCVTHCGMGVMLIDMAVFATMPQPWFILGFNPTDQDYIGEDVFFCRRAMQAGFPTYIDQTLSQSVRHVGTLEYTAAHACATRAAYNAMVGT